MSYGVKRQIKKEPKNGFYLRAKHGLMKSGFLKDQLGLICEGRKEPVERERREEEEEEEEEEKKKKGSSKERYGNYFEYEFGMDHMEFKA